MNTNVTADIEENTLTLKNGEGETQSFEVKGKNKRDIDVVSSNGKTTFTYKFPNGVTVAVTSPGYTGTFFTINVSKDGAQAYKGRLASGQGDPLIKALKEQAEKEQPEDPTALEGGKNKKKTRKRVSRKKPLKLSRRRKFTHSK